jgi:hypothetical protein
MLRRRSGFKTHNVWPQMEREALSFGKYEEPQENISLFFTFWNDPEDVGVRIGNSIVLLSLSYYKGATRTVCFLHGSFEFRSSGQNLCV